LNIPGSQEAGLECLDEFKFLYNLLPNISISLLYPFLPRTNLSGKKHFYDTLQLDALQHLWESYDFFYSAPRSKPRQWSGYHRNTEWQLCYSTKQNTYSAHIIHWYLMFLKILWSKLHII